jgi:3-hydroxy-3-methylglutaryl CoA synthase
MTGSEHERADLTGPVRDASATSEVGVAGVGAYVPYWRLRRSTIGEAWGIPAMPGERAVAAADEDALTMAVEAAVAATDGVLPGEIDGVIFASTTSPYREKQAAATLATVLDCRKDIITLDITDSLRAATTALRVAADAIRSGSARVVVVCAGDARLGEPESSYEQMFGDSGAACVLASKAWFDAKGIAPPVRVEAAGGVSQEFVGPWRSDADRFVRTFESKLETQYGYAQQAVAAAKVVLAKAGVEAASISRAVIAAPDPRAQSAVASKLGIAAGASQDTYFDTVGNTGVTAPLLMLAGALEHADADETLLLVGAGDGADALVLRTSAQLEEHRRLGRWHGLTPQLESKAYLASYEAYARNRRLVERERAQMWSSAVTYWRDIPMELPLYGMTCRECATVQFPIGRYCMECSAAGPHENTRLARRGRVFTFTLDHLVLGEYWNEPVPRAVVDLDGGGRIFCELTDCDPNDVRVDVPVELTFRCLHEGAGFRNYFWKGRPLRTAVLQAQEA